MVPWPGELEPARCRVIDHGGRLARGAREGDFRRGVARAIDRAKLIARRQVGAGRVIKIESALGHLVQRDTIAEHFVIGDPIVVRTDLYRELPITGCAVP